MEKEKGILGRLLAGAGALVVLVGVFVFQGITHAEDSITPADDDAGMVVGEAETEPVEDDGSSETTVKEEGNTDGDDTGESGATDEPGDSTEPTTLHAYIIDYYSNKNDLRPLETQNVASAEDSYTFTIISTVPDGGGKFLG